MRSRTPWLGLILSATLIITASAAGAQPSTPSARLLVQGAGGVSSTELGNLFARHRLVRLKRVHGINLYVVKPPAGQLEAVEAALRQDPRIRSVERDQIIPPAMMPNDADFSAQYHLTQIGCPAAWSMTTGTASAPIAILDSGVDPTHPDLVNKLIAGFNIFDNTTDTHDVYGHGTMVAGIAAAASNNSIGVSGVAWANPIMPIRITDTDGYAYTSTLAAGLVWAADHGARVANISFAVFGANSLSSAAQYFASKGGVTFAAGGNDGFVHNDVNNPWILSVAATDQNDQRSDFSSSGPYIDLAAPGVDIMTTMSGGGYGAGSGTSFASPLAAGVAGLLFGVSPTLTPTQITDLLTGNARDLGVAGPDPMYGWGRVDAANAVAAASALAGGGDQTPPLVAISSPATGTLLSGAVSVLVNATDDHAVTRVVLYADDQPIGTLATAPYLYIWNTSGLLRGSHTLTAAAYDAAGNRGVSISVTVNVMVWATVAADTTPPSVRIISPQSSPTYRSPGVMLMFATATDNVRVARVIFYIDGVARVTAAAPPYAGTISLAKLGRGAHTLVAKATDSAGNVASSSLAAFYKSF